MERLLIVVLSAAQADSGQMRIASAAQHLGCGAVLCCLQDAENVARRTLPENWRLISAAELFAQGGFCNEAFYFTQEEFRVRCGLLAVQRELQHYQEVVLAGPNLVVTRAQAVQLSENSIAGLPAAPLAAPQTLAYDAALEQFVPLDTGLLFFGGGEKLQRWLAWTARKMAWIFRTGMPACQAQKGIYHCFSARLYCVSYLNYAPQFGCALCPLPAQAVELAKLKKADKKKKETYRFSQFHDGTPIPPVLAAAYGADYRLQENCKNDPFSHPEQCFAKSSRPGEFPFVLPPVLEAVHAARADLKAQFNLRTPEGRHGLVRWYVAYGAAELGVPEKWVRPVREALEHFEQQAAAQDALQRSLPYRVKARLGLQKPQQSAPALPFGVNLCGFIKGDFGLGESARITARVLRAANIPFTIVDFQETLSHTYQNNEFAAEISNTFPYRINLFVINGDLLPEVLDSCGPGVCEGRYNIGYWAWELPEFPAETWEAAFPVLDEIWTCSDFTSACIRQKSPVPVFTLPLAITVEAEPGLSRADFGLPEDKFIFMMLYDVRSVSARKNPEAAVDAFLEAFAGRDDVCLLMKLNVPEAWDGEDDLLRRLKRSSNVLTLAEKLSKPRMNALIEQCDALVSLHRSEGFGLGPAEAMYLGKPAVLTNWSGNTQYMRPDACCPVDYTIVEIEQDYGPYRKGMHWAQPDLHCAAALMRKLVEDSAYYQSVSAAGKELVRTEFSPAAVGGQMRSRFAQLKLLEE